MPDFQTGGSWSSDAPIAADAWKRAVYKRPPRNFHAEVLPPEKHGNSYNYGFRIHAIRDDNASIITRTTSSGGSIASMDEYDIWRKWEDCLMFQDTLEIEYARAARDKRKRLAAGKGVKKNGVYIHSDQAASWESLPFGPDPNDVANDIHVYIPKLSKKGTLFRVSQETIDHRYQELQKMIYALLQDDLPTLIKEIKSTLTFSDFFGIWRRDIDLARKASSPKKPAPSRSRTSLSNSILSAFPVSPSSVSTKSSSPIKGKAPERAPVPSRILAHSDSSCSDDSVELSRSGRLMDRKQEIHSIKSRGSSSESHASSSSPSTPVTVPRQLPSTSRQPAVASQEMSIRFDHNPHVISGERRSSILESLPEDRELASSPKSDVDGVWTRKRSGSTASNKNRNTRIYVPTPPSSQQFPDPSSRSLSSYSRASMQSTHSSAALRAAAYLDELGVDYCLPSPTPEPRYQPRASVSSMASIVTNCSVDAVIPRSERPSRPVANNTQRSPPHMEEPWGRREPWSEDESEDQADILDAYFSDLMRPSAPTPDGFPQTPGMDESMFHFPQAQSSSSTSISSYSRVSDRRSSLTTISSGSTSSSGNPMTLSIKAIHEDNIIILRVPRHIAFDDLRRKIYDKFMRTDKATICKTFAVALMEQVHAEQPVPGMRSRAGSLSSLGSASCRGAALHFISSQDEWDDIVATHSGKLLLRIIGSRE